MISYPLLMTFAVFVILRLTLLIELTTIYIRFDFIKFSGSYAWPYLFFLHSQVLQMLTPKVISFRFYFLRIFLPEILGLCLFSCFLYFLELFYFQFHLLIHSLICCTKFEGDFPLHGKRDPRHKLLLDSK